MKKFILAAFVAVAVVALSSCSISRTTASQGNVGVGIGAAVISDLDVSNQKVTYTFTPKKAVRRGVYTTALTLPSVRLLRRMVVEMF